MKNIRRTLFAVIAVLALIIILLLVAGMFLFAAGIAGLTDDGTSEEITPIEELKVE